MRSIAKALLIISALAFWNELLQQTRLLAQFPKKLEQADGILPDEMIKNDIGDKSDKNSNQANPTSYLYKIHYNPLERINTSALPESDPSMHWTMASLTKSDPVTIVLETPVGFGSYLHANAHFYGLYLEAKKYGIKTKVIFRMANNGNNHNSTDDATMTATEHETKLVRKIQECFPELYDFEIDRSYKVEESAKVQQKWLGHDLASELQLKSRTQLVPESMDKTFRLLQQILLDKESYPPPRRQPGQLRLPFLKVSIVENYHLINTMYDDMKWLFDMDQDVCCPRSPVEPELEETVFVSIMDLT
jgi:hypothetical protein